ncbi:MAG: hypothetical protein FWC78_07015 [Defluviitaleaceae bacterium]|nr:hypothetical protein [Defluviitaleaceae bacterium]
MENRRVFKKNFFSLVLTGIRPIIFTAVIVVMVVLGIRQAEDASRAEGVRLLEEALMRAAVHSYAVEGFFPESLEALVENYNIFIDHTRFIVHYDVFATNLPPNILVFERR